MDRLPPVMPSMHRSFPRLPLIGAGAVMLVALAAAATGQREAVAAPPSDVLVGRSLTFTDRSDGGIDVKEGDRLVDVVAPETNGFLRSTLRGLARERSRRGLGPEIPFRLLATRDGQVILDDPATGRSIPLAAFGPTNAEAFARLLPPLPPSS